MANQRIIDLPQIQSIGDASIFYTASSVKDYHSTGAQLKTYLGVQEVLDRILALESLAQTTHDDLQLAKDEQIGTIQTFSCEILPENYLACDGAEVLKSEYAKLYAKIGDTFGNTDLGYGAPSDEAHFRIPNLLDRFIRNTDGTRALGTIQDDTMQKITGQFNGMFVGDKTEGDGIPWGLDGAFYKGERVGAGNISGAADKGTQWPTALFDSSRVVRTDAETRPKNISLIFAIKTA